MVQNYILETEKGFIVIDTGYPNNEEKFLKRFKKIGKLSDISYIFLTHAHDDHAGFLNELLKITSAKIILNPLGVKALEEGKNAEPEGSGYSTRLASTLFGSFKKEFNFPTVEIGNRAIFINSDEEQFFKSIGLPIKIIMLPGHTSDSIGLYLEETKELFCGDAAMNAIISIAKHTIFMEDIAKYQESWDKIITLNPNKIYPSHGSPFNVQELVNNRAFMNGKKLTWKK